MFSLLNWKTITAGMLALVIIMVTGYVLMRHAVSDSADATKALASKTAQALSETLNITPHVTINGLTVIQQSSPILELAVLQEPVFKEYAWSHTYLGSTKTLVLRGEFLVKTGFNLQEAWQVNVATRNGSNVRDNTVTNTDSTLVIVQFPQAKILSLEMKTYRVERDESGFWNHITTSDRENAVNAMQREVRATVESSGILTQTRAEAERRIREALQKKLNGSQASIRILQALR
jgi:hypothetical protein